MKNTKIIMISECPYAGILRAIVSNAEMLKNLGFDVHLVIPETDRDRYGEIAEENIASFSGIGTVHRIPLKKGYMYMNRSKKSLKAFLSTMNVAYIVMSYGSYAGKITRILYRDSSIKYLYHMPQCIDIKRMTFKFKLIETIFENYLAND